MSDNCCTFVVLFRGAGNTIKTAVTPMNLYLITDSDGWTDCYCYTSAAEAMDAANDLFARDAWANTLTMKVHKLNGQTRTRTLYAVLVRDADGFQVEFPEK